MKIKRLTYVSREVGKIGAEAIAALGKRAAKANSEIGVTGVLIYSGGIFYQVIEGPEEKIDSLFERISQDKRHIDVSCIEVEADLEERRYPDWSMRSINLDVESAQMLQPIRELLSTLTKSREVLAQYTQPSVVQLLGKGVDPLCCKAVKVRKIILFSDIMGFNHLASNLDAARTLELVNVFLSTTSEIVAEHGGIVTKLIGDCLMANFSANQADASIRAGMKILSEIDQVRQEAPPQSALRALHCGVGLDSGVVVEGNIGCHIKKDFTIIGEAANHAAWIESLTRHKSHLLLFSKSVQELLTEDWSLIELGDCKLKHGQDDVTLFSVDDPLAKSPGEPGEISKEIERFVAQV